MYSISFNIVVAMSIGFVSCGSYAMPIFEKDKKTVDLTWSVDTCIPKNGWGSTWTDVHTLRIPKNELEKLKDKYYVGKERL